MRWVIALVLTLTLAGAAFGAFVAWLLYAFACDENCTRKSSLATWQLVVALVGLGMVCLAVRSGIRRRRRTTFVLLALGVLLYGAWGIMADAGVHGWSGHGLLGPYPLAFAAGAFVVVALLVLAALPDDRLPGRRL